MTGGINPVGMYAWALVRASAAGVPSIKGTMQCRIVSEPRPEQTLDDGTIVLPVEPTSHGGHDQTGNPTGYTPQGQPTYRTPRGDHGTA